MGIILWIIEEYGGVLEPVDDILNKIFVTVFDVKTVPVEFVVL